MSHDAAGMSVSAVHKTVVSTLPDGRPYAANDPDALRFAYAPRFRLAAVHDDARTT